MVHPIYRVISFKIVGPYKLKIDFNDGTSQTIDFHSILEGELFGPLRDEKLFNQVDIDPEIYTLVWPNGADFDPATLHEMLTTICHFKKLAHRVWESFKTTIAFTMAAFNILVQTNGFEPDENGFVHLSIANFNL